MEENPLSTHAKYNLKPRYILPLHESKCLGLFDNAYFIFKDKIWPGLSPILNFEKVSDGDFKIIVMFMLSKFALYL